MPSNWTNKYFKFISALQQLVVKRKYPLDTVLFRDCSFLGPPSDIDCKCKCDLELQQLVKTIVIDESCMFRDIVSCQMFHYYILSLFYPANYHVLIIEVQQQEPHLRPEACIHTSIDMLIKCFVSNRSIEREASFYNVKCYGMLEHLTVCSNSKLNHNTEKQAVVAGLDEKLALLCTKLSKLSSLCLLYDIKEDLQGTMFDKVKNILQLRNGHLNLIPVKDMNFTSDMHNSVMAEYRSQT